MDSSYTLNFFFPSKGKGGCSSNPPHTIYSIAELTSKLLMNFLCILGSPVHIPAKMASEAGIFQGDYSSRIF